MPLILRTVMAGVVFAVCAVPGVLPVYAQDPLKAFPNNYKLALDNSQIRVLRCHYGPHEKVGVHNHSDYPTVYVYLSDSGEVRFSHIEEHAFVMTRPPVKKGSFRVSPGRPERHTVENLSNLSSDYLRIELKQIPLHGTLHPFRGEAPASLDRNATTSVFSDPELSIQRILLRARGGYNLHASGAPSLLITFSSAKLSGALQQKMQSGDIAWLPATESLSIAADASGPAHLLLIQLPPPKK